MAYRYSVFAGFPLEEIEDTNYDSINLNDLFARNGVGRRLAKHNYGRDFQTYLNDCRHTFLQSNEGTFNNSTFSTWFWFEADGPVNDCVLCGRFNGLFPIWAIKTISGHIAFETGNGLGSSHSILGPIITNGNHFIAITYDNPTKEMTLYFDGTLVSGQADISMPATQTGVYYSTPWQPFNGWLDTILWTELVLNKNEFDTIYNTPDGHDVPWYYPDTIFGKICIIKHDRIIIMERIETCIVEHSKTLIANVKHGRR